MGVAGWVRAVCAPVVSAAPIKKAATAAAARPRLRAVALVRRVATGRTACARWGGMAVGAARRLMIAPHVVALLLLWLVVHRRVMLQRAAVPRRRLPT